MTTAEARGVAFHASSLAAVIVGAPPRSKSQIKRNYVDPVAHAFESLNGRPLPVSFTPWRFFQETRAFFQEPRIT